MRVNCRPQPGALALPALPAAGMAGPDQHRPAAGGAGLRALVHHTSTVHARQRLSNGASVTTVKPSENKGLWSYRGSTIFCTGYTRRKVNGRLRKFRILIEAASFEKWLSGPGEPAKGLGQAAADKIKSILTEAAKAADC